ncbi:unnamed protein product [Clonostachys rosea]|uniref:Uncharacterized protein n=1 Tax=Bionectria ochroleuca TaxID=29856 RepID=A0ABY6TN01_BIOOC|nr:unnamed protein product [Clonostachys rosea]
MSIKGALLETFRSVEEVESFALLTRSTDPQTTRNSYQTSRESESRQREGQARLSIKKPIEKLLRRWLNGGDNRHDARSTAPQSNCLCHFLDDDYKISNISLEALRNRDLSIIQALNSLSSQLGFEIFLAVLDKELVGSCQDAKPLSWYTGDHPLEEYLAEENKRVNFNVLKRVIEKNYRIATLVGLDGDLVAENLHLNESALLETDGFNAVKPKVKYENDMDSALVIVPQHSLLAFFQQTPELGFTDNPIKDPQSAAGFLAKASLRPQAPASYSDNLLKFCCHVWGMKYYRYQQNMIYLSEEDYSDIVYAALRLGKMGLFDKVLKERCRLGKVLRGVIDGILKWLDFADRKSHSRFDKIKSRYIYASFLF